jgi:hypothetical protein
MACFSNQKSQFGYILEGIAKEDVGIFYGHLVYLFCRHFVYFMVIWYIVPVLVCCTKKNLATLVIVKLPPKVWQTDFSAGDTGLPDGIFSYQKYQF